MFTTNVDSADRLLRILVGLVLIALVFVGPKTGLGLARRNTAGHRVPADLPGLLAAGDQHLQGQVAPPCVAAGQAA